MVRVAAIIEDNPELLAELVELLQSLDSEESQQAAWALSHLLDLKPDLGTAYLGQMIPMLNKPAHNAVHRAVTRYLQFSELPEAYHDEIWDSCSRLLSSAKTAIAIKVFAMTTLSRIVEIWPELSGELRFMIEEQMPFGSAGFRNRGRKILAKLRKLEN